jgi:hypothetical protein
VLSPIGGAEFTDIGTEFDVTVSYAVTRVFTLGAGFGRLFPGKYLKTYSPGAAFQRWNSPY